MPISSRNTGVARTMICGPVIAMRSAFRSAHRAARVDGPHGLDQRVLAVADEHGELAGAQVERLAERLALDRPIGGIDAGDTWYLKGSTTEAGLISARVGRRFTAALRTLVTLSRRPDRRAIAIALESANPRRRSVLAIASSKSA